MELDGRTSAGRAACLQSTIAHGASRILPWHSFPEPVRIDASILALSGIPGRPSRPGAIPMHFKFLSEVGHHYGSETTNHLMHTNNATGATAPLRMVALRGLSAGLLRAKTMYERLDMQYRGLHGPRVSQGIKDAAAALMQASGGTLRYGGRAQPSPVSADQVATAKAEYEAALRHFQNQGGVVNDDGTLDWGASDRLVVYDRTAAAQDLTKLRVRGGLLYTDDAGANPFDTSQLSTFFSKVGYAIYVMSEEGNIHAANHAIGYRHHSSLMAAANAAGAGEMKVENGRLKWISNKSGHYVPGTPQFIQTLHMLQKQTVDLGAVAVQFHTATGKTEYATVADFLATLDPEEDYYHAKMIAYINSRPYPVIDALVQANGWRFPDWNEYYTQGKKGLLDQATGNPIPHKLAAQYFKRQGVACDPNAYPALLQSGAGR
jgi:hypothetical protein